MAGAGFAGRDLNSHGSEGGQDYMKSENSLKVTKERRDDMIAEIKNYFSKEREEEIGGLAAGLILDFTLEKIAPKFYN